MTIDIRSSKTFAGGLQALGNVRLHVGPVEMVALIGAFGSVRATGAHVLEEIVFGVLPQVMPL